MRIDALLAEMRRALRSALPEKAFLRRDRGDALFITNAPAFEPALSEVPGFRAQLQAPLMRILPDESWIFRLEENPAPDQLSASLARFRGDFPDAQNILLFVQGAKLLDDPSACTPDQIAAFDRALRQSAAIALRGGCGGGLYACALMNAEIHTLYKGEKAT